MRSRPSIGTVSTWLFTEAQHVSEPRKHQSISTSQSRLLERLLAEGVSKTKQADGEIHEDQLNFLVNRLDEEVSPR